MSTAPGSPVPPVPAFVADELAAIDVTLSAAQLELLARYLDLLLETNKQFNLTAIKDPDAAWRRHIIDSLTLLPGLADVEAQSRVIDVGSGGGLPGIPIAIARPDLSLTLLEATGKKARFLERCVAELPLANATVLNLRAESAGRDIRHREKYEVVVCRAVGPMAELLEYTLPLARVGGRLLAMKGPSVERELEVAGDALAILGAGELQVIEAYPAGVQGPVAEALIVSVSKDHATPREFPRAPGMPRQEPL